MILLSFSGSILLLLCGVLPRIAVLFVGWDFYITLSTVYLFLLTTPILTSCYVSKAIGFHYSYLSKTLSAILLTYFALLIASIRYAITLENPSDVAAIITIQVVCTPVCLFATMDLLTLIGGSFEIIEVLRPERNQVAPEVVVEPVVEMSPITLERRGKSSFNCRTCSTEFSNDKLPKNLIYCDHTFCQQCLQSIYELSNSRFIECPICMKLTVVKGGVPMLSTNKALLDVIEEVKKKN